MNLPKDQVLACMDRNRDYTYGELSQATGLMINDTIDHIKVLDETGWLAESDPRSCSITGYVAKTVKLSILEMEGA